MAPYYLLSVWICGRLVAGTVEQGCIQPLPLVSLPRILIASPVDVTFLHGQVYTTDNSGVPRWNIDPLYDKPSTDRTSKFGVIDLPDFAPKGKATLNPKKLQLEKWVLSDH
jgi:hypothetical protein